MIVNEVIAKMTDEEFKALLEVSTSLERSAFSIARSGDVTVIISEYAPEGAALEGVERKPTLIMK